jgi:hypothetical protein
MLVILHRLHISHIALALQGVQVIYYFLRGMGDTTPAIGEALQQRALPLVHRSGPSLKFLRTFKAELQCRLGNVACLAGHV